MAAPSVLLAVHASLAAAGPTGMTPAVLAKLNRLSLSTAQRACNELCRRNLATRYNGWPRRYASAPATLSQLDGGITRPSSRDARRAEMFRRRAEHILDALRDGQ